MSRAAAGGGGGGGWGVRQQMGCKVLHFVPDGFVDDQLDWLSCCGLSLSFILLPSISLISGDNQGANPEKQFEFSFFFFFLFADYFQRVVPL